MGEGNFNMCCEWLERQSLTGRMIANVEFINHCVWKCGEKVWWTGQKKSCSASNFLNGSFPLSLLPMIIAHPSQFWCSKFNHFKRFWRFYNLNFFNCLESALSPNPSITLKCLHTIFQSHIENVWISNHPQSNGKLVFHWNGFVMEILDLHLLHSLMAVKCKYWLWNPRNSLY